MGCDHRREGPRHEAKDTHTLSTYLKRLLGGQDLSEKLASPYAEGVAEHAHFLDILHVAQRTDMRLQVFGSIELQALPFEGEDLGSVAILRPLANAAWRQTRDQCNVKYRLWL